MANFQLIFRSAKNQHNAKQPAFLSIANAFHKMFALIIFSFFCLTNAGDDGFLFPTVCSIMFSTIQIITCHENTFTPPPPQPPDG